jgi:hypothetical protein
MRLAQTQPAADAPEINDPDLSMMLETQRMLEQARQRSAQFMDSVCVCVCVGEKQLPAMTLMVTDGIRIGDVTVCVGVCVGVNAPHDDVMDGRGLGSHASRRQYMYIA